MEAVLCPPSLPPLRPMLHSTQLSGMPISRKAQKYAIMNAPPPYCAASPGKRKKLPKPTALPATASMTPRLLLQFSSLTFLLTVNARYYTLFFREVKKILQLRALTGIPATHVPSRYHRGRFYYMPTNQLFHR